MRRTKREEEQKSWILNKDEGETLVGPTGGLGSSGGERESDRAKMREDGRVGEREGVTA